MTVGNAPYGLAFDGETAWVTNRADDTVIRINAVQARADAQPIQVGANPKGIAVDDQRRVWVANADEDTVSVVANGAELDRVKVGRGPRGVVFAFDSIWVSVSGADRGGPYRPGYAKGH